MADLKRIMARINFKILSIRENNVLKYVCLFDLICKAFYKEYEDFDKTENFLRNS